MLAGGGATDDPEGAAVLQEVMEEADDDPDVIILNLPPWSAIEINALQSRPRSSSRSHFAKASV